MRGDGGSLDIHPKIIFERVSTIASRRLASIRDLLQRQSPPVVSSQWQLAEDKTLWREPTKEKKGANLGEYSLSAMVEEPFVRQKWTVETALRCSYCDVC